MTTSVGTIVFVFCVSVHHLQLTEGFCNGKPSGVQVNMLSKKTATVSWNNANINCGIIGYDVHYEVTKPLMIYRSKNVTTITKTSVQIDVIPSFQYKIYVYGLTSNNEILTPDSKILTVPHTVPERYPGGINLKSKTQNSLTISWDEIGILYKCGDISGYKIFYQGPDHQTKTIDVTGEKTTEYTITGLSPVTNYKVIMVAVNDIGKSPYSTSVTFTTASPPNTVKPYSNNIQKMTVISRATTKVPIQKSTIYQIHHTSYKVESAKSTNLAVTGTQSYSIPTGQFSDGNDGQGTSNKLPFVLAIIGGILLLMAILIPLGFFVCRSCCAKPAVVPDKLKDNKKPIKDDFRDLRDDSTRSASPDSQHNTTEYDRISKHSKNDDNLDVISVHSETENNENDKILGLTKPVPHPVSKPLDKLQFAGLVSVIDIFPDEINSNVKNTELGKRKWDSSTTVDEMKESGGVNDQLHSIVSKENKDEPKESATILSPKYYRKKRVTNQEDVDFIEKHVRNTNNIYIHNFLNMDRIFSPKREPQVPTIQLRNSRSFRESFINLPAEKTMSSPSTIKRKFLLNNLKPSSVEPRAILEEPF